VTNEGTKDIPFLRSEEGRSFSAVRGRWYASRWRGHQRGSWGRLQYERRLRDTGQRTKDVGRRRQDAALIVQHEMRHKRALDHPNTRVHPAVFETLHEVELHLAAMLSRGSYESHDTVMQGENRGGSTTKCNSRRCSVN